MLEEKAAAGLSYSEVAHLRWDMRQIFRMAVSEALMGRNPADLSFVPPEAPRPDKVYLTADEVRVFFSVLEQRERVIGGLAILAGLRPGEIFGLTRNGCPTTMPTFSSGYIVAQWIRRKTSNRRGGLR